jgi:His/Glu/Gln/Arg/opine family amino acid ABC transporter permease subunit
VQSVALRERTAERRYNLFVIIAATLGLLLAVYALPSLLAYLPPPIGPAAHEFGQGAQVTLELTAVSGLLGLAIGMMVGIARVSTNAPIRLTAGFYVWVLRGTPLVVQLLFVYFVLPSVVPHLRASEFTSAICALGLNIGAYNAEVIRGSLLSVPRGQLEAAAALGLTSLQTLRLVVMPQALRVAMPGLVNNLIGLLKDSSLAYVIGVVELSLVGNRVQAATLRRIALPGVQLLHRSCRLRLFNGGYSHDASSSRDHALTPGFNFTYDVNSANTLYGNISKGYRIGGPNRPVPASVCAVDLAGLGLTAAPGSYKADSLWNYELGTKSLFLDNRLALNLDAFYIKWSQIQQDVYLNSCGYDFFQNVGAARSYGSEAEIRAAVGKGVSVAIAGAYTLATFTEAAPSLGVHAGDPVEGAPVWNGSATVEWRGRLTGELQGFTSLNYRGTGNSHGALSDTNPDYLRPSYGSLNASVGVALRQWEFSLFSQNLTNEQKTIQRPNIQSVTEGVTLRPLTIGIAATGRF